MSTKVYGAYLVKDESSLDNNVNIILKKIADHKLDRIMDSFYMNIPYHMEGSMIPKYLENFHTQVYCKLLEINGKKLLYTGSDYLTQDELSEMDMEDYSYTDQTDDFIGTELEKFWRKALQNTSDMSVYEINNYSYNIQITEKLIKDNITFENILIELKASYAQDIINKRPDLHGDSMSQNATVN
jgi:hypothetical protein